MSKTIGIRREDKNVWERRTPLTPAAVKELQQVHGIRTVIQPSPIRIFNDEEYRQAGAEVNESLSAADWIFAIKEIPEAFFEKNKTYVFFSHTIKGQPHNMSMLKKMVDLRCQLIDYERVLNEKTQRLIFFGKYAGLAGMVETLHAFGQKLKLQGFYTPFEKIKQAFQYPTVDEAKKHIAQVGNELEQKGFPVEISPLVFAFTGYGHVSQGAQEIFNLLPHQVISPAMLLEMLENVTGDDFNLFKVVFKEEDMVEAVKGRFELQDYYDHPEKYRSTFANHLPHISVLVNCIYWAEKYPRLVTKEYLKNATALSSNLKLKVIGDISCDINGSIEITHKATKPDHAFFTYFAHKGQSVDDIQRNGITVMAVDNLPCEFPRESSIEFSKVLKPFIPEIVPADFNKQKKEMGLPDPIERALILLHGEFTPDYQYMKEFLKK